MTDVALLGAGRMSQLPMRQPAQPLSYRDLTWARFKEAMVESGIATGVVMLVIMGSAVIADS